MSETAQTRDAVRKLATGWLQAMAQKLARQLQDGGADGLKPADLRTLLQVLEATDDRAPEEAETSPAPTAATTAPPIAINPIRAWTLRAPQTNTVSRLARLTKVDRARLSRYMNGRVKPSRDTKEKIEAATDGAIPAAAWDGAGGTSIAPSAYLDDGPLPNRHRWGKRLRPDQSPADTLRQQADLLIAVQDWFLRQQERRLQAIERMREERADLQAQAALAAEEGDLQKAAALRLRVAELTPREPDDGSFVATIRALVEQHRRLADSIDNHRPLGFDEVRVTLEARPATEDAAPVEIDARDDDEDTDPPEPSGGEETDDAIWSGEPTGPTALRFPVPEELRQESPA